MSEVQLGIVILAVTTFILFSGVPVAFGLTIVSVGFLAMLEGAASLTVLPRTFMTELSSFAVMSIPMFVLFGAFVGETRAGGDLFEAIHRWMSRVPGGLVIANIAACGFFGALAGSSAATAAAIGKMGVPEMLKRGVKPSLATGSIAAGGTLGILIPPSITMIIYAIVTEISIGRIYIAGIIPGMVLTAFFAIYAWLVSKYGDGIVRKEEIRTYTLREKVSATIPALPLLFITIFICVALFAGWATPSEIAAISALFAFFWVALQYSKSIGREIVPVFAATVRESCMILMIIAAASLFSYMLSLLYVTQSVADLFVTVSVNRWVIFAAICLFLMIAGCFLPPVALILMTMPIFQPVLEANKFDMIWFGIVITIILEIALISPPAGLNLYILRAVAPEVPLAEVLRGSVPFVFIMLGFIALLCIFPGIAMWLPEVMLGQ
jgi:C4-dicarboxylate transporter DctM subunit